MTAPPASVLALDQGTTSSRAIVFDAGGNVRGMAQAEFPQLYPAPAHVEHDPEAIWDTQLDTARRAVAAAGIDASAIAGIGITNQRETLVVWERDSGKPVHNAVVWQSRITEPICRQLVADGLEPLVRERTGLVVDPYFTGTKITWLFDKVDGLRARAEAGEVLAGTIDCFLLWRLTGGKVHATDATNASRTLLYDIHRGDWDDDLLAAMRVPRAMLPEVRDSSGRFGETDPSLFGAALPVAGIAGDQQAATFGHACFEPGMAKNTYGTGCFMLVNTGERAVRSENGLLTTIGWQLGGKPTYCLEGSVFVAGAAVQWLRDGLGLIRESADVERLAATVDDSDGVCFVPAFVGLGTPWWDPAARGTIVGLTRGTTAGHIARATLESMAFQSRDVLEAMRADSGLALDDLRVDGGAAVNDGLMQFQADILGCRVQRPVVHETTALGAAYLAGLATGVWDGPADVTRRQQVERVFEPRMPHDERIRRVAVWSRAVERARGWAQGERQRATQQEQRS